MTALKALPLTDWHQPIDTTLQHDALTHLEQDDILFFPHLAFTLQADEQLLLTDQYSIRGAKNISYHYHDQTLRGMQCNAETHTKLLQMMRRFQEYAQLLINNLLPRYTEQLQIGRTSYRPVEIHGRIAKSYKKDDTRLHVDAFPSNPTQGKRILRVFSNINPHNQPRVWNTGESFEKVAEQFYPKISSPLIHGKILKIMRLTKSLRTPYDHIMLQIHDRMKHNMHYQKQVHKNEVQFPAGSTWIVQTDSVSHAALSGQFALEQTFYLPAAAMENQMTSPLRILEKMAGKKLI